MPRGVREAVCASSSSSSTPAGLLAGALREPRRGFFSFLRRLTKGNRKSLSDAYTSELSAGLGPDGDGGSLANQAEKSATTRTRDDLRRAPPGSSLPPEMMKELAEEMGSTALRTSRLGRPMPLSYDLEVRRRASRQQAALETEKEQREEIFDERNMPRDPHNPHRARESWEFTPTPEHKALVLLLYRNVLKGLIHFKSVRRRSLIAYARIIFRRRATATEKLLIDECIEEARRALYVLGKHHAFTHSREYEFDSMTMPKDTGQDVKTYMEDVYDPEVSRSQFQHFADVQPGKEHLHRQKLGPTSGEHHFGKSNAGSFKPEIKEEDKALRPPPPPGMS